MKNHSISKISKKAQTERTSKVTTTKQCWKSYRDKLKEHAKCSGCSNFRNTYFQKRKTLTKSSPYRPSKRPSGRSQYQPSDEDIQRAVESFPLRISSGLDSDSTGDVTTAWTQYGHNAEEHSELTENYRETSLQISLLRFFLAAYSALRTDKEWVLNLLDSAYPQFLSTSNQPLISVTSWCNLS